MKSTAGEGVYRINLTNYGQFFRANKCQYFVFTIYKRILPYAADISLSSCPLVVGNLKRENISVSSVKSAEQKSVALSKFQIITVKI